MHVGCIGILRVWNVCEIAGDCMVAEVIKCTTGSQHTLGALALKYRGQATT